MTVLELQEKLTAAQEKVIKCQSTLEKRIAKLDKLEKIFDADNSRMNEFNYSIAQEDYKTTEYKLKDLQLTVDGWQKKLDKEIEKQKFIADNTPEILKNFLENWKQQAIEWYLKRYDSFIEYRKTLRAKEREARITIIESNDEFTRFRKADRSEYNNYEIMSVSPYTVMEKELEKVECDHKTLNKLLNEFSDITINRMLEYRDPIERKQWLKKDMEAEKQAKLLDLMYRITEVVGTITDCSGLNIGYTGLIEGLIIGTKANARIETIEAGGYNIQCWHFRTLVHKVTK